MANLAKIDVLFDELKFREMILYIAERTMDDPNFGKTKMAKTLWISDFLSFIRNGKPISGATYQKLTFGHAAREFIPTISKMKPHEIAEAQQDIFGNDSTRYVALRKPNLNLFTAQEISVIDLVINKVKGMTAVELSELSHKSFGWAKSELNENIPYCTALIPRERINLSSADIEYGKALAANL